MEQAEFQQKQSDIYMHLAAAVIESIPEDWDEAELMLGPMVEIDGRESMRHELRHPQLTSGVISVIANEDVFLQTNKLELLFREFGAAWAKATFRVTWEDADNQWRFVMEYEYDD